MATRHRPLRGCERVGLEGDLLGAVTLISGVGVRRIFWTAVGAAGGIIVYRQGQRFIGDARERGMLASAQKLGVSAVSTVTSARALIIGSNRPNPDGKTGGAR